MKELTELEILRHENELLRARVEKLETTLMELKTCLEEVRKNAEETPSLDKIQAAYFRANSPSPGRRPV